MTIRDPLPTVACVLLLAAAVALLLLAAPLHRVRRAGLTALCLAARFALTFAVIVCGLFAACPSLPPPEWATAVFRLTAATGWSLPPEQPVFLWLGLAALVVVVGLPMLAYLEYARSASALTTLLAGLHRQARIASEALRRLPEMPASKAEHAAPPDSDVVAGAAVLRTVIDPKQPPAPRRPRLVRDLLTGPRA